VAAFCLLTFAFPGFCKSLTLSSEDQFEYSRSLMERGRYEQAVAEFERFIHFFAEDRKIPAARYLIGLCHLYAEDYAAARAVLEQILEAGTGTPIAAKALFLLGESFYRQGIMEEARIRFRALFKQSPPPSLKNAALYRLGWCSLRERSWKEASRILQMVEPSSRHSPGARILARRALEGENLPYKNPATAGILAGILPGLGHSYVGRHKDGAVALLLNGIFVWAALESFHRDHEVLGGILTFLELGWYSGNIYSAVNAAHKFNRKVQNDFLKSLEDRLDLRLLRVSQGDLGLALTLYF
jgi:tetratricopeptide (TPR) repeat protein